MKTFVAVAALLIASLVAPELRAEINLPMTCQVPADAGKPVNTGCGGRAMTGQLFRVPLDTDLVRVRASGAQVADWESADYQWRAWRDVKAGEYYDACKGDVPVGSAVAGSSCSAYGMIAKSAAAIFTATPASGRVPLPVTVSWAVPDATQCQAGGAWSGAKAANGSEQLTLTAAGKQTLTLTCSVPGPRGKGQVQMSWVPPTTNTDGSAYKNPAGYSIYLGRSEPFTTTIEINSPATVTYIAKDVDPGAWIFAIDAVNTLGDHSEITRATHTVLGVPTWLSWSGSAGVDVAEAPARAKPKAPVLTITEIGAAQ